MVPPNAPGREKDPSSFPPGPAGASNPQSNPMLMMQNQGLPEEKLAKLEQQILQISQYIENDFGERQKHPEPAPCFFGQWHNLYLTSKSLLKCIYDAYNIHSSMSCLNPRMMMPMPSMGYNDNYMYLPQVPYSLENPGQIPPNPNGYT